MTSQPISKTVKISGGRLIDPANHVDQQLDVFIENGRVLALGAAPADFVADEIIDAKGLVVCPGLIDLQARLCEPGYTQKGTIATELAAAAAGGVTTLCCPPDTQPAIDTTAVVQLVLDKVEASGLARVLPMGALTRGLEGEHLSNMVTLSDTGCVALSNARGKAPSNQTLLRCLEYAATYDLLVYVSPEDTDLARAGCVHEGEVSMRLGLNGLPEVAETMELARYLLLAEQVGARIHVGQLSSARAVEMVQQAQARGVKVSADIAMPNLLLNDECLLGYDSAYHLLPPLRTEAHRQALLDAVKSGAVTALCSNHCPQDAAAKEAPFGETAPGMIGLQTFLSLGLGLVKDGVLELSQLLELLTAGPAKVLESELGRLNVGAVADVCIFDPDADWLLDSRSNCSQASNTPYWQQPLQGQVRYTLLAGNVVFSQS